MVLRLTFRAIALVGISLAAPAITCPPPPPPPALEPGETEDAYRSRMAARFEAERIAYRRQLAGLQEERWQAAAEVFVGRIDAVRSVKLPYATPSGATSQNVRVSPIRWLKGAGSRGAFWLRHTGMTTCGPYGAGDAVDGKVDEMLVFFAGPQGKAARSVVDSVGSVRAEDSRVRAALSAR